MQAGRVRRRAPGHSNMLIRHEGSVAQQHPQHLASLRPTGSLGSICKNEPTLVKTVLY